MDDQMAARLRAQEAALREVVEQCSRVRDRLHGLSQTEWRGPAGDAYRFATRVLDDRLWAAYLDLVRAMNCTARGIPERQGIPERFGPAAGVSGDR